MIDVHCHLEQEDYSADREELIEKWKKELKAIITCCAHPNDFELTLSLVERHKGFIFCTAGIHPEYVCEIPDEKVEEFFEILKRNREKIHGIGEVGLDFFWIKDEKMRERQRELFTKFIHFADELKLPLVIHSRGAYDETVEILEKEDAKKVLLHMFGANHLVKRVIENGWFISVNTILLKSKKHKKIVRDMPLERIMLETDSPWLSPSGGRNEPTSVKIVAEKISEIKKISVEDVDKVTTENAVKFFDLRLNY